MSTELLKAYVYNEPIAVAGAATGGLSSPGAIVSGMGLGKVTLLSSFYTLLVGSHQSLVKCLESCNLSTYSRSASDKDCVHVREARPGLRVD